MASYALAYYGEPQFSSQEDGAKYQEKWKAWEASVGDALGALTPLHPAKKVSTDSISDNGGENRLSGFCMVTADSLDAAIEMAQSCPHLEYGTIDVSEVWEM